MYNTFNQYNNQYNNIVYITYKYSTYNIIYKINK